MLELNRENVENIREEYGCLCSTEFINNTGRFTRNGKEVGVNTMGSKFYPLYSLFVSKDSKILEQRIIVEELNKRYGNDLKSYTLYFFCNKNGELYWCTGKPIRHTYSWERQCEKMQYKIAHALTELAPGLINKRKEEETHTYKCNQVAHTNRSIFIIYSYEDAMPNNMDNLFTCYFRRNVSTLSEMLTDIIVNFAEYRVTYITHFKYSEYERFVQKIGRVTVERDIENPNKNTFDFVRVRVSIPDKGSMSSEEVKRLYAKYKSMILSDVLAKIASCKSFVKYGVPINILRLSRATVTSQREIEFLFELKEVI